MTCQLTLASCIVLQPFHDTGKILPIVGSGLGPPMGWVGLFFVLDMTDFLDFVILVIIK